MRDDVGGRLFYIDSNDRHDGKRSTLILACHGDGDNIVMFKTQAPLSSPPSKPVFFDYRAGTEMGRAEASWTNQDVWTFRDSKFAQAFAKSFLRTAQVTVGFPGETGAAHAATWSRSTAADFENQLTGWCLKP
ncbi:MAG TPA: hypothetical protein VF475_00565 [Sphingobium sp.]